MKDTADKVIHKQLEIFLSKPTRERFLLNLELTEFVREMIRRRILRKAPCMPDNEIKAEMFREMYIGEFPPDKLNEICEYIKTCMTRIH